VHARQSEKPHYMTWLQRYATAGDERHSSLEKDRQGLDERRLR
jgi:hypothetical protein